MHTNFKYHSRKELGLNGIEWYISMFTIDGMSKSPEKALDIIVGDLKKERYEPILNDSEFVFNTQNMPKEVNPDENHRFEVTRKGAEYMNVNMIYKGGADNIADKGELAHKFLFFFNVYSSNNGKINKRENDWEKSGKERDCFLKK